MKLSSYQAGVNGERELFIESSSFAASGIKGIIATNAGLALLLAATPAGWVGVILGGALVAGAAAGISMGVNYWIKEHSGDAYDSIVTSLDIR